MAEDFEDGASASGAANAADALAAQIAMNAPPSSATEAYLEKHGRLLDLQIENLKKQDEYETSHLRWRRFRDQMSGVLQLSLALVAAVVVAIIATSIWNASKADGVVIEAFSVPPDLAAKGITGQVVASDLQDKLNALQAATFSLRAPSSYANNWGDDIKVQIPDTGVSIGEFNRYLRQWLGHETQITGEVWHTTDGIAVVARAGGSVSPAFTGSEADLPKLIEQAAESIYRATQPYRYAIYSLQSGHDADARAVLAVLSRDPSPAERAWAHIGLASVATNKSDDLAALTEYRRAAAEQPGFALAYNNIANGLSLRGHDEQSLAALRAAVQFDGGEGGVAVNPAMAQAFNLGNKSYLAFGLADPLAVLDLDRQIRTADRASRFWETAIFGDMSACGLLHDIACLRDSWAQFALLDAESPTTNGFTAANREGGLALAEEAMSDWAPSAAHIESALRGFEKAGKAAFPDVFRTRTALPNLSIDYANLGDIAKAKALIVQTPLDCTVCLIGRGVVAQKSGDRQGAAMWFARADAFAPSLAFVSAQWGQMLLESGDAKGAIAKFTAAAQRAPHFADPLEGWGEALMLQNRSDLALAKFEEASRYAPHWGRLHLKWGEALHYAGNDADAAKQLALAAAFFLTAPERAELAKASHV